MFTDGLSLRLLADLHARYILKQCSLIDPSTTLVEQTEDRLVLQASGWQHELTIPASSTAILDLLAEMEENKP